MSNNYQEELVSWVKKHTPITNPFILRSVHADEVKKLQWHYIKVWYARSDEADSISHEYVYVFDKKEFMMYVLKNNITYSEPYKIPTKLFLSALLVK